MLRRKPVREWVAKRFEEARKRGGVLAEVVSEWLKSRPVLRAAFEEWKPKQLSAKEFYEDFKRNVVKAEEFIEIFSPFTHTKRVEELCGIFKTLPSQVVIIVHTLGPEVRSIKSKKYHEECLKMLGEVGVDLILRRNMHEKAVFIDKKLCYLGSLNVLSGSEADYMLKFESTELNETFLRFIYMLEAHSESMEQG